MQIQPIFLLFIRNALQEYPPIHSYVADPLARPAQKKLRIFGRLCL